jgi:hypothetical protein
MVIILISYGVGYNFIMNISTCETELLAQNNIYIGLYMRDISASSEGARIVIASSVVDCRSRVNKK